MNIIDFYYLKPDIFSFKAIEVNSVLTENWKDPREVHLTFHGEGYYINSAEMICHVKPLADDYLSLIHI